jgi:hypothetical protein
MREIRSYGSVEGVTSDGHPYSDPGQTRRPDTAPADAAYARGPRSPRSLRHGFGLTPSRRSHEAYARQLKCDVGLGPVKKGIDR